VGGGVGASRFEQQLMDLRTSRLNNWWVVVQVLQGLNNN
jgi:hypothetical protein